MKATDINYEFLASDIYTRYRSEIEKFDCDVASMNMAFKSIINQKVTTILFFDIANNNTVVGYCSYRCSSIKVGNDVYPAIEIYSFAIDKCYQDKYLEEGYLCAAYILGYCREKFKQIRESVIYAEYIILYAYNKRKIQKFYERNGFTPFSCDHKTFRDTGEHNDGSSYFFKLGV